jgi:hypothetical protein
MSLGFQTKYDFGDRDVVLARDVLSATCQLYFFITLIGKGNVNVSKSFGTCDDGPEITRTNKKISLRMIDPQGKKKIYLYENGIVLKMEGV